MKQDIHFHPSLVPFESFPETDEQTQLEALQSSRQLSDYAQYRARVRNHPHNPSYHFYAPDGRLNDPNGLCFWKGKCHLFYQAYPPRDPRQHWGHMYSDDMVHWKDLPLAIYPDQEYAVFSGAALAEDDRVIAMYHGRWLGNMIAVSSDPLLLNWKKSDANPVLPLLKGQLEGTGDGRPYSIFDPFIWKDESGYYALSGSMYGNQEERGKNGRNVMAEHLFHSQDLDHWTYMGELTPGGFPQIPAGNDGACPYFLPLGNRYVLFFFSHATGAYALIGDLDPLTHRFTPEKVHKFCFGPLGTSSYQAPCAACDGNGGVYLIFNVKDAHPGLERQGLMSMMYHVTLGDDSKLRIRPVDTIDSLHGEGVELCGLRLPALEEKTLDMTGKALDIKLKLRPGHARALRITLMKSADGREHTDVTLHLRSRPYANMGYLTIDTTFSSLSPDVMSRVAESTNFDLPYGEAVEARILLDKCMLEVFVNDRVVLLQTMYPTLPDSHHVSLTSIGGDAEIDSLQVWTMKSIYE